MADTWVVGVELLLQADSREEAMDIASASVDASVLPMFMDAEMVEPAKEEK